MRAFVVFVLCVCAAFGWLLYQYLSVNEITTDYVKANEDTGGTGAGETGQINQTTAPEEGTTTNTEIRHIWQTVLSAMPVCPIL